MCQTEEDYESLPNSSLGLNMVAGAFAGITEHVVTYPLDVLKTRMQFFGGNKLIYTTEGLASLWRGVNSVILGSGPAHALYFGSYEASKETLKNFDESEHQHLSHAASAAVATLCHDGFMTPFDVVKQRLQINTNYSGMIDCARAVYRTEGLGAFYISFPVTLMMNVPFQILQFSTYEYMRKRLNPSGEYNPMTHVIAGGIAGGIASASTNPLDVAKTALQTRGNASDSALRHASGLVHACKIILQNQGLFGFTRGMQARVLAHIPSTAAAWTTYEFLKMVLSRPNNVVSI